MSRFRDAYMDEQAEQKVDERVEEYKQTMEWFDWFVTTEEYKELIKEISNEKKLVSETVKPIE
jgi:hypothetical protein